MVRRSVGGYPRFFSETEPSPYRESSRVVTTAVTDEAEKRIECRYPVSVQRNIQVAIVLTALLFVWGWFFIDDPGWIGIGCMILVFFIIYYRTRIHRVVIVDEEGISETGWLKDWHWPWPSIVSVREKYLSGPAGGGRVIVEHESGREIILDHHMLRYGKARSLVLTQARRHRLNPDRRAVSFFIFPYW